LSGILLAWFFSLEGIGHKSWQEMGFYDRKSQGKLSQVILMLRVSQVLVQQG
jgi:hypothetical protein